MDQNDFIKGALIGGVLGGIAALLAAPKSGQCLRNDIAEGYNTINKRSREFVDGVKEQGHSLYNAINGIEEDHSHTGLMAGGALGAVIGALAALLVAPKAGHKLREQLGDKYEEIRDKAEDALGQLNNARHNVEHKLDDWRETLVTLVDKLTHAKHNSKKGSSSPFDEIVDWANLGIRLYSQFQKRR